MRANATRLRNLLEQSYKDELTPEERVELEVSLNSYIIEAKDRQARQIVDSNTILEELAPFHLLKKSTVANNEPAAEDAIVVRSRNLRWLKYVAAAAVVTTIVLGGLMWNESLTNKKDALSSSQKESFQNDVPPGSYKAKLTLADGTTIFLDTAANGQLAKQGSILVKSSSGQLVYLSNESGSGGDAGNIMYNTLSTARSESYATVLSDGSKIWLNAESSIRFPVAFVGRERRIEVNGEVYLEVAHSPKQPFVVDVHGTVVEVLGTHFAINAYANEKVIKTSLLEGKVRVSIKGKEAKVLSPGQQAQVEAGSLRVVSDVDVQAEVLWKDGIFSFAGANLAEVLRQLQRWYNVDILYRGMEPTGKYFGRIDRNLPLSVVLKNLEMMTETETFKVEGRAIIVSSKK